MHSVTKYLNPFSEIRNKERNTPIRDNNDLYQQLICWTLENLEILNLNVANSKIKELLEKPILEDASCAQNYNIAYPSKESKVCRWMPDLGFA